MSDLVLNQKESQRVGELVSLDPLSSRLIVRKITCMQFKTNRSTNRSIKDSVFVNIHELESNTCKTL